MTTKPSSSNHPNIGEDNKTSRLNPSKYSFVLLLRLYEKQNEEYFRNLEGISSDKQGKKAIIFVCGRMIVLMLCVVGWVCSLPVPIDRECYDLGPAHLIYNITGTR